MKYKPFGTFRLLLAILVMVQHFVYNTAPLGPVYNTVIPLEVGSLAVLVFFALSGFVIAEAVHRLYSERPFAYLANRFLRIAPHFVVAIAVSAGVFYWFDHTGTLRFLRDIPMPADFQAVAFTPRNIGLNLIGFLPGMNHFESYDFIMIAWAVRVEMVFYFAMFAILLALPVLRRFNLINVAFYAYLPIIPIVGLLVLGYLPDKVGFISYFGFGVALYFATAGFSSAAVFAISFVPLIALHFFSQPLLHENPEYVRAVLPQFAALMGMLVVMTILAFIPVGRFQRLRRFDRAMGDLTYPLYLYHQSVTVLVLSITTGYSYLICGAGMLLSLMVAFVFMKAVDPVVNLLRDMVRGQTLRETPVLVTIQEPVQQWSTTL